MNDRFVQFYLGLAHHCSDMSRAVRLRVGCVIVNNDNVISHSWNGTPRGWDNTCEYQDRMPSDAGMLLPSESIEQQWPLSDPMGRYRLVTKPEVLHAERNALDKLSRNGTSGQGSTLFVTHAPCVECAKSVYSVGIKEVYFSNYYRSNDGIEFLEKCGIPVKYVQYLRFNQ